MCPACLANAAAMVAGVLSAGGLTVVVSKWRTRKKAVDKNPKQIQRRKHERCDDRASQLDVEAVRRQAGSEAARRAGLVRSELPSTERGGSDETVPPGHSAEHLHAYGGRLLGDGGQHREPRTDRRRVVLRKQRGNVGCMGAVEADHRRLARDVRQQARDGQSRKVLRKVRSLEREA